MYHHVKKLMYTVRVDEPDPAFGNMLLEQFGGANGELAAAMQYSIQGLNCDDPARKDLLMDIGTEELSHLEVVGTLARLHIQPMKVFSAALESMQKRAFSIGQIPPSPEWVNKYFNDSTGQGDDGESDARGPWNEGGEWEYVEAPAFAGLRAGNGSARNGATRHES